MKVLQDKFQPILLQVFNEVPKITHIKWTQYTPYFNDGETCEFSVRSPEFFTDEMWKEYEEDDYAEGFNFWHWNNDKFHPDSSTVKYILEAGLSLDDAKLLFEVSSLIKNNKDFMQELFGDHVQITVDKDGITVDEYDHD